MIYKPHTTSHVPSGAPPLTFRNDLTARLHQVGDGRKIFIFGGLGALLGGLIGLPLAIPYGGAGLGGFYGAFIGALESI